MNGRRLTNLSEGQLVPYGGDRVALVDAELAARFVAGDRLVVVHDSGDLLHIPAAEHELVERAVTRAADAFTRLAALDDASISRFFDEFAARIEDDESFATIAAANAEDVARAEQRGRSTTRLQLSAPMRAGMVAGLRVWRDATTTRDAALTRHDHGTWLVETCRAPLGVVGFVFEGRPNVFADAAGVLRTGNTVVFRIGSDALGTARAIMAAAVVPACAISGVPLGAVNLLDSTAHAAGWALFADHRLGLAVARGSGRAVAQLGAVARQHGVPASLHGTGGAWMVVAEDADPAVVHAAVQRSLDRKVCNTLNVCCVVAGQAERLLPVVVAAGRDAARLRGASLVLHATVRAARLLDPLLEAGADVEVHATLSTIDVAELAVEWEWESDPELSIVVVDDVDAAVALFNRWSPRFAASLISASDELHRRFFASVDAPFVGNGFTRWVDGQFAFDQPELGLSNWQHGRLLARGGVLSGDSVHTIRTRATVVDHRLHR